MAKKVFGDYYIGLDIGTDSVGWAAAAPDYQLLKLNGKAMWGSRLFSPAQPAAERRAFRVARRRLERRAQRLALLQDLFAQEIAKVDPNFYVRLREGGLHQEDKTVKQPENLFADVGFRDADYHRKYPTIYHLRKELTESAAPHDVRLVYLAVHHIVKYRGHFLFGSDLQAVPSLGEILTEFSDQLEDTCGVTLRCDKTEDVYRLLTADMPMSARQKQLNALFGAADKQQKSIIRAMTGGKVALQDIFPDFTEESGEKVSIQFGDAKYDEIKDELADRLGENFYILEKMKAIHDWMILEKICPGGKSISAAKVAVFDQHRQDLRLLKKVVKKYAPEDNNLIFHSAKVEGNYASYVGMTRRNGKKVPVKKTGDAYDKLVKLIRKTLEKADAGDQDVVLLKARLDSGSFLPKAVIKDNGVIPYQLHYHELEAILENAASYLPFLNEKDETGLSVREKVLQLMIFRIPYYVGPLNDRDPNGKNTWVVRRTRDKIYPWNFEQVVDLEQSAQRFISRMTSRCTYLADADVLPQNSILYSKFMVLNELNNVKVDGQLLSVETKQAVFNDLFEVYPRVTVSRLVKYLNSRTGEKYGKESVSGLAEDFRASMRSEQEMRKALGEYYTEEIAEEFIYTATVFGDSDKLVLRRLLSRFEGQLPVPVIQKAASRRFSGWGRLSRAFLAQLMPEKGEDKSIIEMMWDTQNNLMQLLSADFGYLEAVRSHNKAAEADSASTGYSLVRDLYVSPPVKRAIWQALSIVKELRKVTGHDPKKIFVEMARGPEEKKEVKDSRKKVLMDLYRACKDDSRDWLAEIDRRDEGDYRGDKLYLYYTQMGKCMYTGETIDINRLFDANLYDIDHIYPRAKVKDDSLNNRVLVKHKINMMKGDDYPLPVETRDRMRSFWYALLEKKLISREKYDRLVRGHDLTSEELSGFISRQLVETRQSTKAVAQLLRSLYQNSEVVYVKAGNVSDFRKEWDMLKCREVNDLHHAKDAYLNIVVGNVYNTKFTHDPRNFFREKGSHYNPEKMYKSLVQRDGMTAWLPGETGSIAIVRRMMAKNNPLVSHMSFEQRGAISDIMLKPKGQWQLPQKGKAFFNDAEKYGGYNNVYGAYFMLVEHTEKGKQVRSLIDMPIYLADGIENKGQKVKEYLTSVRGLNDPVVIMPKIKVQSCLEIDGLRIRITGRTNDRLRVALDHQLVLGYDNDCYIRNIVKYSDRASEYGKRHENQPMPVVEQDHLSAEKNLMIYDMLINKLTNSVYSIRLSKQGKDLLKKRSSFMALSINRQCFVLKQMLILFSCDNSVNANLTDLGLAKNAGSIKISRCLSKSASVVLITQSVTGLFEQRIDLLR